MSYFDLKNSDLSAPADLVVRCRGVQGAPARSGQAVWVEMLVRVWANTRCPSRIRAPSVLPVLYAERNRRLYVRLPVYNDACNFLDRADVALDVDATSAGRVLVARVAGTGLMIPYSALPADLSHTLEEWPDDLPTIVMVLVPESVRQIPVADDVRYPPLPEYRLPGTFADR